MSLILTAFFRYLVPLYLLSALSMVLAALSWHHFHYQQVLRLQLQQYADTVELSLRPTLGVLTTEQLTQRLAELQFSAVFPVATLALYQQNGQLLAVAGAEQDLPSATTLAAPLPVGLQQVSGRWLAIQPIKAQALPFEQFGGASGLDLQLLIIPDVPTPGWRQFWPALFAIFWLSIMLWLAGGLLRNQQRRQQRELTEIADAMVSTRHTDDNQPTQSFAAPIQQALQQQQTERAALAHRLQVLEVQQQQLEADYDQLQQQLQQQAETGQKQRQCINRWLTQAQLLWQRQEQLSPALFQALLSLQYDYARYQFTTPRQVVESLQLTSWLQQALPALNTLLPQGVALDYLERSDNLTGKLTLDPAQLFQILQALLLLALRSESGRRLQFRIALDSTAPARLTLQLNGDGNGLPKHLSSQLSQGKLTELQWRDADIALLQVLQQQLEAEFRVESLDGLGISLNFSWPVQCEPLPTETLPGSLLLFDSDPERLSERLSALSGYALQVSSCNNLSELQQRLAEQNYELLLLMLPGQTPGMEWQHFLQQVNTPFVAFAAPLSYSQWQQLVPCRPSNEFCLAILPQLFASASQFSRKKLLVVDDNETNQAFIQVLLQRRQLELFAAHSAEQALAMCQQQHFDLILLDIRLPDLPGTEVAKRLRQQSAYRETPILAFTAHALEAEITEFKAAGMDDIVLKPLDPCKFDALLAEYRLY